MNTALHYSALVQKPGFSCAGMGLVFASAFMAPWSWSTRQKLGFWCHHAVQFGAFGSGLAPDPAGFRGRSRIVVNAAAVSITSRC